MLHEKIDEMIRERIGGCAGGSGLEEVLLLQCLTNGQNQGLDLNALLPILLLGGGGSGRRGRIDKLALVALIAMQQSQAAGGVSGGAPPNNMLPLLLALGLLGEDREFAYPSRRFLKVEGMEDEVEEIKEDSVRRSKKV